MKSSLKCLNESNYATWKVHVKMQLKKDDLFKYVDGSVAAPTDAAALAIYRIKCDRALAIIVLSIDPSLLYIVGDPEDPKEVWNKLQSAFQRKTGPINLDFGVSCIA